MISVFHGKTFLHANFVQVRLRKNTLMENYLQNLILTWILFVEPEFQTSAFGRGQVRAQQLSLLIGRCPVATGNEQEVTCKMEMKGCSLTVDIPQIWICEEKKRVWYLVALLTFLRSKTVVFWRGRVVHLFFVTCQLPIQLVPLDVLSVTPHTHSFLKITLWT